jgi:glutathione S-transferase
VTAAPLTLFVDAFFATPFDFRVWVALREKGLPFTTARVMIDEGSRLSPTYKEQSVTARVPGLAHGDFFMAESLAIVEYLEESFPPPEWPALWPAEWRARARARQLMSFLGSDLFALNRERPAWTIMYAHGERPPLGPAARAAADELMTVATRVVSEGVLREWSIASADLAFALLRLARNGEVLAAELQAIIDENLARPSVQSYIEHARPPNPPQTGRRAAV